MTEIGAGAFSHCTALTEINLPDSLTKISDYSFFGCEALKEIHLPEDLTEIGFLAFQNCTALKKITYSRKIEPRLKEIFGDKWERLEKIVRD